MVTKKNPAPAPDPKKILRLRERDYLGMTQEQVEADSAQSPIHTNAATALTFSRGTFGESGLTETVEALRAKVEKVKAGDLSGMDQHAGM